MKPETTRVPLRYTRRRTLFQYTFEGGGQVNVVVDGDVPTTDAMWALRELMAHKDKELEDAKAES